MAKHHFHNYNIKSNTYVEEKRAPTDESVRLLKEMEEAAKEKIVDSVTVRSTVMEFNIQPERQPFNDRIVYRIVYSLNGKKSKLEVPVQNWDRGSPIDVAIHVRDELAKDIASQMIDEGMRLVESRGLFREIG